MSMNPSEFRRAMGCFATGVTIITVDLRYEADGEAHREAQSEAGGEIHGEVHGMTANAFASVSLDPPLVLVCVDQKAVTHTHLHAKKRFGVNVLRQDQRAISEYYANPERRHARAESEAGARFDRTRHGTPMLRGTLAYLECRLRSTEQAGDHTIFIAEVEDVVVREGDPLLFYRGEYRRVSENAGG